MKSLQTIQKLSKLGEILSKIAFVCSVVGFCGCIVGLIGLGLGGSALWKLGNVTVHGLLPEELGGVKSIAAALSGWLIVCVGEAVLAKFAEGYFRNERKAGTPFTLDGAKELLRLGILTLAIPTGCAVLGGIVRGIVGAFLKAEAVTADVRFNTETRIVLGIAFLLGSLLCRYGAELREHAQDDGCENPDKSGCSADPRSEGS